MTRVNTGLTHCELEAAKRYVLDRLRVCEHHGLTQALDRYHSDLADINFLLGEE